MTWNLFKPKPKKELTSALKPNEDILPDDKQSRVVVQTSRINTMLVSIGTLLITIFLGSLFFIGGDGNKQAGEAITSAADLAEESDGLPSAPRIPPALTSSPQSVSVSGTVGEETALSISLNVSSAPARVLSVEPSLVSESISIDNDCVSRANVSVGSGCTINIFYNPTRSEKRNMSINVAFIDPSDSEASERTFRIPLSISSTASAAEEEYDDYADEEEFNDFADEDSFDLDEGDFTSAPPTPAPAPETGRIYPDCKKFASRAYDFAGVFLGWAHAKDVYAPNCSKIIGQIQPDGMVVEAGSGRIVGKGMAADQKAAEDKRIELVLPILNELSDTTRGVPQAEIESVIGNRESVKGSGNPHDFGERHRADDPLGLFNIDKNRFRPDYIRHFSTGPKDERYVLRQTKPIPATLVRPIYFPGDEMRDQGAFESKTDQRFDAVATVERNVYGGDGRTIVIPAGSMLIGEAEPPNDGGIIAIQKIDIRWTRLIRPDGAEFNLEDVNAYTADAQGRFGVAGKNDTEHMRDMLLKPLLFSALPVAMEAMFPSSQTVVTRFQRSDGEYDELDNMLAGNPGEFGFDMNKMQQVSNMSPRDKMKLEFQRGWQVVANEMLKKSLQRRVPFTVPAGTRIQIFLNDDIMLKINDEEDM